MTTKHSEQQEKQMKQSLSPAEKKLVQALSWRINETFSPYGKYAQQRSPTERETKAVWAAYEGYRKERRRIGKTVDPATAETMFAYADTYDPYDLLPSDFHGDCYGREQFARKAGAGAYDWIWFGDLPAKTARALWKRDGHKLSFPYGIFLDADHIVNYPPTR